MGMSACSAKSVKSEINITPYIDILLVLLIIFMLVTPIRQTNLKVEVPQAPSLEPALDMPTDIIVLSIGDNAEMAINNVPVDFDSLAAKLREIYLARLNKNMFISASPTLPYGDVARAIDISKGVGVADIGLLSREIH